MKLVVFGLSLSSSWGNGHATTYRALLRAFAARGHDVTFFEWEAPWYGGEHRDLTDPDYCDLILYPDWTTIRRRAIAACREADAVVVGSFVRDGIRLIDDLFSEASQPLFFYDIDTPVTVSALRDGTAEYLRRDQIPAFAAYLSFTGGPFLSEVIGGEFRARAALPLYCSVDAEVYSPTPIDPELAADLSYIGTYAADRQPVVEEFLIEVARRLPERRFIVAGPQYPDDIDWPPNVRRIPHLPPHLHPAFYASANWQLNATRVDMVDAGWSPSVRLFEAGAVGAPVVSDSWMGLDQLFQPGREIVLPRNSEDVVHLLREDDPRMRRTMAEAFRARVLAEHTSTTRAAELERHISEHGSPRAGEADVPTHTRSSVVA